MGIYYSLPASLSYICMDAYSGVDAFSEWACVTCMCRRVHVWCMQCCAGIGAILFDKYTNTSVDTNNIDQHN